MSTGKYDNYLTICKVLFKNYICFPTTELEERGI